MSTKINNQEVLLQELLEVIKGHELELDVDDISSTILAVYLQHAIFNIYLKSMESGKSHENSFVDIIRFISAGYLNLINIVKSDEKTLKDVNFILTKKGKSCQKNQN